MPNLGNINGIHIIVFVAVLAIIGEFASGIIRKGAWTLALIIVGWHTLRVYSSK